MSYKLYNDTEFGNLSGVIQTLDDKKKFIPINEENTDYLEYLEWVAEGNTADEAD
tara:strand:+ start:592 stop:756 length:165 start_codon:yes stop_codon:yes gene_type:complete